MEGDNCEAVGGQQSGLSGQRSAFSFCGQDARGPGVTMADKMSALLTNQVVPIFADRMVAVTGWACGAGRPVAALNGVCLSEGNNTRHLTYSVNHAIGTPLGHRAFYRDAG